MRSAMMIIANIITVTINPVLELEPPLLPTPAIVVVAAVVWKNVLVMVRVTVDALIVAIVKVVVLTIPTPVSVVVTVLAVVVVAVL